ncbi:MAG: hypothetical protein ACREDS_11405 [Limisphaerales bacterium]
MKPIRNLLRGLLVIGGFIVAPNFLHAQDTTDTASVADTNVDWSQASDSEVELRTIEMAPPIPYAQLSESDMVGTFWSAQHSPLSLEPWPPLPMDLRQSSVWSLGTDNQGYNIF